MFKGIIRRSNRWYILSAYASKLFNDQDKNIWHSSRTFLFKWTFCSGLFSYRYWKNLRRWNLQKGQGILLDKETKNFISWWTKSPNRPTINIPFQIFNSTPLFHTTDFNVGKYPSTITFFSRHTLWRRLYCNVFLLLCVFITIVLAIKFSAETGRVQPKRPEQM